MPCNGQNLIEMLRRGDAVVEAIQWAGFTARRWALPGSPPRTCSIGNKGLVLTHGQAAPVELEM